MNPTVSIITVNYHSEDDIITCLESISRFNSGVSYEFILVSNSPLFEEKFANRDQIKVIQLDENYGFAYACNRGAETASGEYLFFLNPDTTFLNNAMLELLNFARSLQQPALIGPKTFNEKGGASGSIKNDLDRKYFIQVALPFLPSLFKKEHRIYHYTSGENRRVAVVNGHAIFIKKSLFKALGGFDERYFMYWEEHDLCLSARKNGHPVYFCKDAHISHAKGTSTEPFFNEMEIHKHRSLIKYLHKHAPHLNSWNKFGHLLGYSMRLIFALLTFSKFRLDRYWRLLKWYAFSFNKEKQAIQNG